MSGSGGFLENYKDHTIQIITTDGRVILGTLKGYDQLTNLVLADSFERVFSTDEGVEQVSLGTYMVRGDCVALIGDIDENLDARINWTEVKAAPIDHSRT